MTHVSDLRAIKDLPTLLTACALPADLKPWPIVGDMMAPRFKRGDFVLCRPVEHYEGDAIYVMIDGCVADITRLKDNVRLSFRNEHYTSRIVSAAWFDFMALARVVHHLECWDPLASQVLGAALANGGRATR